MQKPLTIEPLSNVHATMASLAERSLREMILNGTLAPGDRINEVELAESFGTSRGPLREAIQRLSTQGLLTARSHRGAIVRVFEWEELRELYEVRMALESLAVRVVTERRNDEQLASLSSLLGETLTHLDGDESAPYPADLDFHRRIVEMSGNASLIEMHGLTAQKIELARTRSAHDPVRARVAFEEHKNVLLALIDGNPALAAQRIEEHLQHSLENAEALLRDLS